MDDHETNAALIKLLVAWVGTMFGGITLSGLVLFATLVYTVLQTYLLVRDRIVRNPKRKDTGLTRPGDLR